MADEIKLKAPTVEQQVVVNINGEEKLRSFADTLEKISNNKNLQKYWKTQQELINATADAYGNFSKKASQDNAKELIKVTNALKAMSGTDLSNILPDFDKISKAMAEAQKVAGNIDSAFSVKGFKEAFDSFETLKAYGVDIQNLFSHFGVSSDVGELQKNVRSLEGEVEKLTRRLANAKNANEELRNEFDNFKSGSGFADKLDELDNLKSEMSYLREQAEETFRQFLKLNNITEDGYDRDGFYDDNRFKEYFQNIQSGYLSASDAIQQFKREYSYLLDDSFKSNNDTFGLEQLQAFSNKLDSIFRQVEETSTKINDIISNGVITKSVENLSMDSSLSDSQRSLFGNLLQDEESLKSITALFQKLIEESNKTKNSELFNSEQLQQVLSIFDRIENSLSSLRSVISDVGDGEEFSPLLKALNDIKEAASNIKLNFNMDLGDEVSERLNQKVSQASARQLEAYRKLFSAMKGTGKTNKEMLKFFEPDESSVTELIGTYKGIIERAEKQFKVGNSNIYKKYLGAEYDALKREITNANKQLSRADSKRSENGILGDLFGNTKDLSEVIEQLNKIVSKLDEISSSASELKNVFKEGFNITASVEEIDKLTNRVKELEDELSKIKLNPVGTDKSNISSENQIVESQNKIQDELKETRQEAEKTAEALIEVYRGVTVKGTNGISDKGITFASSRPDIAALGLIERGMSGEGKVSDGEIFKETISLANAFYIDAQKRTFDTIAYWGDETNEAGKKAKAAYESLIKSVQDGMPLLEKIDDPWLNLPEDIEKCTNAELEFLNMLFNHEDTPNIDENTNKLIKTIREQYESFQSIISENPMMGIQWTDDFAEQVQKMGYSVLVIKDVIDSYEKLSQDLANDYVILDPSAIKNVELYTEALSELTKVRLKYIDAAKYTDTTAEEMVKNQFLDSEGRFLPEASNYFQKEFGDNWYQEYYKILADESTALEIAKKIVSYAEEARQAYSIIFSQSENIIGSQAKENISSETPIKDVIHGNDKSNIDASTTAIKEENDALKQIPNSATEAANAKEKFANANKEVKASADSSKTSISEEEKYFNSLGKSLTQYQNTLTSISRKPADGNRSQELQEKIDIISSSIEKLNALKSKTEENGYIFNKNDVDTGKQLEETIKNNIELVKQMSSAQRGSDALSRGKEIDTITKYLNKFTGISKQAKRELNGLLDQLQSGDPSVNVKKIHERFLELTVAERNAGREARNLFDIFKDKKIYSFIGQAASMFSFYDLISLGRKGFQTIRELDTALVDLKKTTAMNSSQLEEFYFDSNDVAKQMGVTTQAIIEQASAWSRLNKIGLLYGDI